MRLLAEKYESATKNATGSQSVWRLVSLKVDVFVIANGKKHSGLKNRSLQTIGEGQFNDKFFAKKLKYPRK
jgi:hypothetical protein